MEPAKDIAQLCESWWTKLADSTKPEQNRFAEQFLELLGWTGAPPVEREGIWRDYATVSYVLRAGSESVAAHFILPGLLEPPSALWERGLDFCPVTRILVDAAPQFHVNHVFITDLQRSYLYDAATDELLLRADSPGAFAGDFRDTLVRGAVEDGSLDGLRRQPRSEVARHLRDWTFRWKETIVTHTECSEETACEVLDRLIVLRYLYSHGVLTRMGWHLARRYRELMALAFSGTPEKCGTRLTALFHDIWLDWKADMFAASPEVNGVLESSPLVPVLLRELSLLSGLKFNEATILESFNYGDPLEKARVRMIPDTDVEREGYLAKQTPATIDQACVELDISDEGYRAVVHWFDQMVALYKRVETEHDRRAFHPLSTPHDLDLFTWSEINANRPKALTDKVQHAVERGLKVFYDSHRQYRTARLLMYLHIISRYGRTKQRFTEFPHVEAALHPRPRVKSSQRLHVLKPPGQDTNDSIA